MSQRQCQCRSLNATSTCTMTEGLQPLTNAGQILKKCILKQRGAGRLGLNEPWESDVCRDASAQGSFKVRPTEERVTQEWHSRSCAWVRRHPCICSHASVNLLCLCGKDAFRSKSNSGTTRPRRHSYLLRYYWIISAGDKRSQRGQSACASAESLHVLCRSWLLTQRKPECRHIPQQVSFHRVWRDGCEMSGRGAQPLSPQPSDLPQPRSPEATVSPFPTFLWFLFLFGALKDIGSVRGFASLPLCCLKQLGLFAAFLWLSPVQEQEEASAAQLNHYHLTLHSTESKLNFAAINLSSTLAFHTDAWWDLSWRQDWFIFVVFCLFFSFLLLLYFSFF